MRALLIGCFLWMSCAAPAADCDCSKLKAIEPLPCAPASAPIPLPQDPQTLLLEKQAQLAALQKEINELMANLKPATEAPPSEPSGNTKTAKKEKPEKKAPSETPKPKEEEKPADKPKPPSLKLVPR
jgi:outer membrane biosynthesis protein TonB